MLTLSTSGEGANSLLLRLHFSPHQSLLHCTLSPAIHFNGSNGTAYNRASNGPKQLGIVCYSMLLQIELQFSLYREINVFISCGVFTTFCMDGTTCSDRFHQRCPSRYLGRHHEVHGLAAFGECYSQSWAEANP